MLSLQNIFFIKLKSLCADVLIIFLPLIPFLQVVREGPSPLDPPNNTNIALSLQWPITFWKWFYKNGTTKYLLSCQPFLSHRTDETHQALKYRGSMLDGGVGRYLHTWFGKSAIIPIQEEAMSEFLTLSPMGPTFPVIPGSPYRKENITSHLFTKSIHHFFYFERKKETKINNVCILSKVTLTPSGPTFPGNPFLPILPWNRT